VNFWRRRPAGNVDEQKVLLLQARLRAHKMLMSLIDPKRDRYLRGLFRHLELEQRIAALMLDFRLLPSPGSKS